MDGGMAKHSATPFDLGPRCDPRVFIFEYFLFSFFFIPPSSWRAASAPLVCRILFTNPQASEQESKRKRERERERNRHEFFCSKKNVPVKSIDRSNSRCPVFAIRRRWRRPSRPFIIIFFYFLGFRRIVVRCVFVGSCGDRIASPIVRGIAAEFFCATPRARTSSDFLL